MLRHPRSRASARSAIFAAILVLATAGLSAGAAAEEKYQHLYVFGDSYADMTLSDKPALNALAPPGVGFSLWRVYPVPLMEKLGIAGAHDVAVGGATASPFTDAPGIPPGLNLPQQVEAFLATEGPGFSFGPRDLVTVNIGGNDIRALLGIALDTDLKEGEKLLANQAIGYFGEPFLLNPAKFAGKTTEYAVGEIDRLIDAGARNFVIGGFSKFSGLPSLQAALKDVLPPIAGAITAGADAYAGAYFNGLQTGLAPYAQDGARIFLFDLARLAEAVQANPLRYGFSGGFVCPPNGLPAKVPDPNDPQKLLDNPFVAVCGAAPDRLNNSSPLQTQYYFGPDGLHLTNGGFELVAAYMANIVIAPDIIAVQPGIVMTSTGGFAQSLLGRLDGTRDVRAIAGAMAVDAPMGLGATEKARPSQAASASRFTSFALGSFLGGNRSDAADAPGYDYDAVSGTAGIEYSISRNLLLGVAANYTTLSADLRDGANVNLDAIQAAAYLSYATRNVFADALVAYGSHDLALDRPGVLPGDTVRGSTDAGAVALAARAGYLFDLGSLRAGPIAGLTYIHSRVGGYTEQGDDLLTFHVSSQTLDSLAGNIGIRFLAPFQTAGGSLVIPHLNVMLEHQFGDDTRTLNATLTQAPLLPIPTTFANFDTRTYGRIDGGVTFQLGTDLTASINAGSTFARDDGQDYRISAGLNYRF